MTTKPLLSDAVTEAYIKEWKKTSAQSKQRIEATLAEWYVKLNLSGMFDLRTPQQLWTEIFSSEDIRNFILDMSIRLQFNLRCLSVDKDLHRETIQMLADCFSNPGYGPQVELDTTWFPQSNVVENSKAWLSVSSEAIEALLCQHSWLFTLMLVLLFYDDILDHPEFAPEAQQFTPFKKDTL